MKKIFTGFIFVLFVFTQSSPVFSTPVATQPGMSPELEQEFREFINGLRTVPEVVEESTGVPAPVIKDIALPMIGGFAAGVVVGLIYRVTEAGVHDLYQVIQVQRAKNHQVHFFKQINDPHLIALANRLCKSGSPLCQINPDESGSNRGANGVTKERYELELYESLKAAGLVSSDFNTWRLESDQNKSSLLKNNLEIFTQKFASDLADFDQITSSMEHIVKNETENGIAAQLHLDHYPWFFEVRTSNAFVYAYATNASTWDTSQAQYSARTLLQKLEGTGKEYADFVDHSIQQAGLSKKFVEGLNQIKDKLKDLTIQAERIVIMVNMSTNLGY